MTSTSSIQMLRTHLKHKRKILRCKRRNRTQSHHQKQQRNDDDDDYIGENERRRTPLTSVCSTAPSSSSSPLLLPPLIISRYCPQIKFTCRPCRLFMRVTSFFPFKTTKRINASRGLLLWPALPDGRYLSSSFEILQALKCPPTQSGL